MKYMIILSITYILMQQNAIAQNDTEIIKLYKEVPGSKVSATYIEENVVRKNGTSFTSKVSNPTLTYFKPVGNKTGSAVIICPGGGYAGLAISHEGYDVAKRFAELGVAAFVLKYRLPSDEIMVDRKIGPLQDAQKAIEYVRENAENYGIDTAKVGIMGFSAGGHLASTASTHFKRSVIASKKEISLKPSFSVLIYPVITMGEETHKGSKKNLIGEDAGQELIDLYSNEKQVSQQTPITFIVHSNDDKAVPINNSIQYIQALNKNGVKNEAHFYATGGHGYGLDAKRTNDAWFDRLVNWMKVNALMD